MSEFQPHPERIETIRRWHIDQAVTDFKPVALFNITITADSMIHTKGLCIEPEHAQIMLHELRAIIVHIESQLVGTLKPELQLVRSGCHADQAKKRARRSRAKVVRLRLVD